MKPWQQWPTSRLDAASTTRRQRGPTPADLRQKDVTLVEFLKLASYRPQLSWLHFLDELRRCHRMARSGQLGLQDLGTNQANANIGSCSPPVVNRAVHPNSPSRRTFTFFPRVGLAPVTAHHELLGAPEAVHLPTVKRQGGESRDSTVNGG